MAGTDDSVGFESQIKPLFRESDRRAMEMHFDLWSYDDVSANADPILERLRDGSMPCDSPWQAAQIDLFESWSVNGKQP
jgi:hypothetical protein